MHTKDGTVVRGLYLIISEVLDQVVAAEAVHEACRPGAEVSTWGMAHGVASSVADAQGGLRRLPAGRARPAGGVVPTRGRRGPGGATDPSFATVYAASPIPKEDRARTSLLGKLAPYVISTRER